MAKTRAHVLVSGRVQGVLFRESTRRQAEVRSVAGWVANRSDGRVEAVFEGEAPDVQWMVDWCRHGPSRARVEQFEIHWQDYSGEFDRFEVLLDQPW